MTTSTPTAWIAADWGTTRLRLWAIDATGTVVGSASTDDGMGRLKPEDFERAFLRAASPYLSDTRATPVLICGMAGARTGWKEAGYVSVPAAPGSSADRVYTSDPRIEVRILPGLSQQDPPDVMRGEETQLAGLLAAIPDFDGVVCLPGTHTKWVRLAGGEVRAFRTAMTGELFALLCGQSTLSAFCAEGWEDTAFDAALSAAMTTRAPLAADLFALRAQGLLAGYPPGAGRARLSGLLIGAEVASMLPLWPGAPVTLLGDPALCALYARALNHAGVTATLADAEGLTLAGLKAARSALTKGPA